MKKINNCDMVMPYFLTNPDWFKIINFKNGGWDYKLKKGAPKEAVDSYCDYIAQNNSYNEDFGAYINGYYYEDMVPLKVGKYDFTPKYVSPTWEKTYLLEPIKGTYFYVFILKEGYESPQVGHGGPTITPDDRFENRKRVKKNTYIEIEVLEYIKDHMREFSERLDLQEKIKIK